MPGRMPAKSSLNFQGMRATVMGLGRFGGGVGVTKFLVSRGAHVTVTDLRSEAQLADSLSQLRGLDLHALCLDGHREEDFRQADLVVVNPAVSADNKLLQLARSSGAVLTTEMRLFWQHQPGRVVAVTGSNGKSTTTALIHAMLKSSGQRCWLGGNIGHSLLPELGHIRQDDWCVLELSSFQLEDLDQIGAAPDVSVVTNFSPNHLDRHGTMANYRRAKQSILRHQSVGGFAVLNSDDADVRSWPTNGVRLEFGLGDHGGDGAFVDQRRLVLRSDGSEHSLPLDSVWRLPGQHNLQNVLAAAAASIGLGLGPDAVLGGVQEFEGLPHRLQSVGTAAGRTFVNDSIATTPESVLCALRSFDRPLVLLAGGYDKRVDLSGMAAALATGVRAVALMGQTAETLKSLIQTHAADGPPLLHTSRDLTDAFDWATSVSRPGDVILLSPGCASYDWFDSFVDRGEQFCVLAEQWSRRVADDA